MVGASTATCFPSQAALKAGVDTPQVHFVLGLALRALGRGDESKAEFRKVLAVDAEDVASQVNLGQLLLQERSYPEAISAFRSG